LKTNTTVVCVKTHKILISNRGDIFTESVELIGTEVSNFCACLTAVIINVSRKDGEV